MGNWYMSQTILMMHQTQDKNTWNQIDGLWILTGEIENSTIDKVHTYKFHNYRTEEAIEVEEFIISNSSILEFAKYDSEKSLLYIKFKSGKDYIFYNVPAEVWKAFKEADSKGSFFAKNIKGKYKPVE